MFKRSAWVLAACLFAAPAVADELEPLVPVTDVNVSVDEVTAALPTVEVLEITEPTVVEVFVPHHTQALPIVLKALWAACAFYAAMVFGLAFIRGLSGRRTVFAEEA